MAIINYLTMNKNFDTTARKLDVSFNNIKDADYFVMGLQFLNLCELISSCEEKVSKAKSDAEKEKDEKKRARLEGIVETGSERASFLRNKKNSLNVSEELENEIRNDGFLNLVATLTGWKYKVSETELAKVMDLLVKTEDMAGFSQDAKNELREALTELSREYSTKDTERYNPITVRFNASMTEAVYRAYYAGARPGKDGKVVLGFKKAPQVQREVTTLIVRQLQKKLETEGGEEI